MAPARQKRNREKIELPPGFPTHKACADCHAEGRDPYILPIDQFYIKRISDPRYKTGLKVSDRCKEHERERRNKRYREGEGALVQIKRETGVAPPELVAIRERERTRGRPKRTRTAAQRKARAASSSRWYQNNKDRAKRNHALWVKANPEQRKKSQDAWYEANKERLKEARTGRAPRFGRARGRPRPTSREQKAPAEE